LENMVKRRPLRDFNASTKPGIYLVE